MGCACRKASRAGGKTAGGKTILGYEVTYPAAAARDPEVYLSLAEARVALRTSGWSGTITTKTA